jgi:hypothetical protein
MSLIFLLIFSVLNNASNRLGRGCGPCEFPNPGQIAGLVFDLGTGTTGQLASRVFSDIDPTSDAEFLDSHNDSYSSNSSSSGSSNSNRRNNQTDETSNYPNLVGITVLLRNNQQRTLFFVLGKAPT